MNKNAKVVITVAGGLLVLARFRKPKGTVTTSEAFDLSAYGGPTDYPQPIKTFALAISRAEGFQVPGSIPQRAHNPGDLKLPGRATLPGTSITQFASDDEGWAALYRQLWIILTGASDNYNLDMSIADMARIYTADNQGPWASTVAQYVGASVDTPLWQVLT
jgi:hypothetical protein